jgi:hypothetical protein
MAVWGQCHSERFVRSSLSTRLKGDCVRCTSSAQLQKDCRNRYQIASQKSLAICRHPEIVEARLRFIVRRRSRKQPHSHPVLPGIADEEFLNLYPIDLKRNHIRLSGWDVMPGDLQAVLPVLFADFLGKVDSKPVEFLPILAPELILLGIGGDIQHVKLVELSEDPKYQPVAEAAFLAPIHLHFHRIIPRQAGRGLEQVDVPRLLADHLVFAFIICRRYLGIVADLPAGGGVGEIVKKSPASGSPVCGQVAHEGRGLVNREQVAVPY